MRGRLVKHAAVENLEDEKRAAAAENVQQRQQGEEASSSETTAGIQNPGANNGDGADERERKRAAKERDGGGIFIGPRGIEKEKRSEREKNPDGAHEAKGDGGDD